MTPFFRRGFFSPCRVPALCGLSLAALSLPGCSLIQGPKQAPAPKEVTKPRFPVFDPTDYITPGVKLPGVYRVTGVTSGEILTIQGVNLVQKGTVVTRQYGVPETVRLAGIVAPAPGQPGWQNTVNKVHSWVVGKGNMEVEVEADPKYPLDLDNHRMVQIYFYPSAKGASAAGSSSTGSTSAGSSSFRSSSTGSSSAGSSAPVSSSVSAGSSGERWNLNRMLVHTGYAVVDLFGATSIDVQKWLNDEEFAKNYVDPKTNTIKPLGLWALGITIPQRGIPSRGKGAVAMMPGSTMPSSTMPSSTSAIGSTVQSTTQSSQTTQTQQTTGTATQNGPSSTGMGSSMPSSSSSMPSTGSSMSSSGSSMSSSGSSIPSSGSSMSSSGSSMPSASAAR